MTTGSTGSPGWNRQTAITAARASQAAYPEGFPQSVFGDLRIVTFGVDPTCGFLVFDDVQKTIWIWGRGTHNRPGWENDFLIPLVGRPPFPGRVHDGCSAAVLAQWPTLRWLLPADLSGSTGSPDWRFIIGGHSRGGWIAVFISVLLQQAGVPCDAITLYTQGCPMPGDFDFMTVADRMQHWRFAGTDDLVPRSPPLKDYVPVGTQIALATLHPWFDADDNHAIETYIAQIEDFPEGP